jgi:predicted dehydrogenase
LKAAVIGAGHMGRLHAQKLAALKEVQLVGVADPDEERARALAGEHRCAFFTRFEDVLGKADAAVVAAPTDRHHAIACACLEAGMHVLVEKPIAQTLREADELIAVSGRRKLVLQAGHVERYNKAFGALAARMDRPLFIDAERLSAFKKRGAEVDVVLDLMIHDIDLILSIVRSPVVAVDAIGTSVFSREIDIANARLRFANGCVANATASRVSRKTERKLRLVQDDAYLSVDLHQKIITVIRKGTGVGADGMPQVAIEENSYEQGDALKDEIAAFLESAATGRPPPVSGEDGLLALRTAVSIAEQVASSRRRFS